MNKRLILTAILASTAISMPAFANEGAILSQQKKTLEEQRAYQYEFERDEQCQGYGFGVKRLGMDDACAKKEEVVVVEEIVIIEEVVAPEPAPVPVDVLKEYVVYFDTDKATIRAADQTILKQAAGEINQYNPSDVLVAGYTDTKGSTK